MSKSTAKTIASRPHNQTPTDLEETVDLPLLAGVVAQPTSQTKTPAPDDDTTAIALLRQLLDLARSIDCRLEAISRALAAQNIDRR